MSTSAPFRPEIVAGDRVYLSHFDRSDAPLMARWLSDLEVTTHLGAIGQVFGIEDEEEWIERVRRDRYNPTFGIVLRDGQRLIGSLGLKGVDHKRGTAELGVCIGEKTEWGKGYGTEAIRLLVDYAFTLLGLHAIHLKHWAFNDRAHRAYLKAGFKDAGRLRSAIEVGGERHDELFMDITREDFGASRLLPQLRLTR
ncbi:MAG: GNAT family N-acetyltransferase [Labilithrix sp.]|nr:GNAT family N-acetyltransferase [Labilithrix sp.]MCW5809969.1 GNAT family N-acetyltransferase [Labilithrix sp.]